MKHFTFTLLLAVAAQLCLANDTLTRAQVYTYNVGDTFIRLNIVYMDLPYMQRRDTTYTQHVVDSVYVVNNPTDYVIHGVVYESQCSDTTVTLGTSFLHNGRQINSVRCTGGLEAIFYQDDFVEGLGHVFHHYSGGNPQDGWFKFESRLIYYSNGSERWGSRPVGVATIPGHRSAISVYPTVSTGTFYVSAQPLPYNARVELVDLHGRTVYSSAIENPLHTIQLSQAIPGIYLYRVVTQDKIWQSGRVVIR